ncbi:nuclear transport factor 2 family protein [Fulvivirgaceae bacterium BMA10]|uniref:Nuclear transport factor 2 family protein n=1 Tax=Splendidivirga corallicola TaxID=3051826 RepID=A0ABT8KQE3_9BACT|nr:nuclear transport factor 2 family protein [Fulvivirgaceae bacterium BMA10]
MKKIMKNALFLFPLLFTLELQAQQLKNTDDSEVIKLVNMQLEGYNARDIDLFVKPYSDSIKIYRYPHESLYTGKEMLRARYRDMFSSRPDLHCKLVNRIVLGNTVIDHEEVTLVKGEAPFQAVAVYRIAHGAIQEVTFIFPDREK